MDKYFKIYESEILHIQIKSGLVQVLWPQSQARGNKTDNLTFDLIQTHFLQGQGFARFDLEIAKISVSGSVLQAFQIVSYCYSQDGAVYTL